MSQGNYDNTNRGALFKNKEKREGVKDPDYRGSINVAEDEYWLSAWLEKSKAGETYMSLRVQPKTPQQKAPLKVESKSDDFDDDIPF